MIQQTLKGVFYVVGFESRFFLGLKTMKKEPMPVIYNSSDKNMIKQDVGARFCAWVLGVDRNRCAIEGHFDGNPELTSEFGNTSTHTKAGLLRNNISKKVKHLFVHKAE